MNDKIKSEYELEFTVSGAQGARQAIDDLQNSVDGLTRAGVLDEKQQTALSKSLYRQSQALNSTTSASQGLTRATRETARHAGDIDEGFGGLNNTLERSNQGFVALRYALYDVSRTAFTASAAITGVGVAAAAAFGSQERAFTEVERIAEGSVQEVQYLRKELMDMSTEIPRSFQELSEIASLGGALGIDSTALDEFTNTVAKFVTLTGVTEEAATTGFGRISQYLGIVEEDYDKLGSAILRAGNISVATEEQVLKFSSAIALPAARAGLLADEVVALGAATASFANINVEGAGSAFSRVFANIERSVSEGGEALDMFATAAGYSSEQFKIAWGSDAGGTFNRIIEGLSKNVDGLVGNLDALGIRNERDRRVVSALALNYQDYMRIVGETSNAWREGIYMNEAYGLVLDDLVSKWQIFQNALSNAAAAVGAEVAPTIKSLLDVSTDLLVQLAEFANSPIGGAMIRMAGTVAVLAAGISALVGVIALAGATSLAFRFALQQIATSGIGAALSGLAAAFRGVGTGATAGAAGVRLFNAALKTLGRITVVGALLFAVSELLFNTREALIWVGEAFIWLSDTVVTAMGNISPFLALVGVGVTRHLKSFGNSIKEWGESFPAATDAMGGATGGISDFSDALDQLEETPDLGGLQDGLDGVGNSADEAAQKVYTLVDYANDLSTVWKRAFDIRFSGDQSADTIADSFQKIRDAAEASAKRVLDLGSSIRSLTADMGSLRSDINILEYYLKIAREYGDTKRATALEAELAKKRAELADKSEELAEKSKELAKEQAAQNKTLVGNTQGARDNRKAILDLVTQYQSHIQALAASGMSQEQLAAATDRLKQDFIAQATQLGYNQAELAKYAKSFDDVRVAIANIPRNITVSANTNPAIQAFNEWNAQATAAMANIQRGIQNTRNAIGSGINIPVSTNAYDAANANRLLALAAQYAAMAQRYADAVRSGNDNAAISWLNQMNNIRNRVSSGGWQTGGYTGAGPASQVAGTVHRGEYVIPKRDVNQATGLPYADALGRLMDGAPSRSVAPAAPASSSGTTTVALTAGTIQAIAQATGKNIYLDGKLIAESSSNVYAHDNTVGAY